MNIALCELGHTYFGISPSTIPLGIGYIASYLKHKLNDDINIDLYKYPERLQQKFNTNYDIMGFGLYNWNHNLSTYIMEQYKKNNPNCLFIAGGLNVVANLNDSVKGFDTAIHGEGEQGMLTTVINAMADRPLRNYISSKPLDDINEIPSPYLTGILDKFVEDENLVPVLQTMRGCPYQCTFCVGGSNKCKLRQFETSRVIAEFEYLKQKAKNRILRFTDENFGLFKRDIEIAQHVRNSYDNEKYPLNIKVYTDKKNNDTVKKIIKLFSHYIPFNISMQTTTKKCLEEIKRINVSHEDLKDIISWSHSHGIKTSTELIHGLPYETIESYMKSFDYCLSMGFDSVESRECWLLPNTVLASDESIKKHGFHWLYTLGDYALTILDDGTILYECDKHTVQSNTMSCDDFFKLQVFDFFVCLVSYMGYFKELSYFALSYDVTPFMLFNSIMETDSYPTLKNVIEKYASVINNKYFNTYEEVGDVLKKGNISYFMPRQHSSIVGGFVFGKDFDKGVDEFAKAIMNNICYDDILFYELGVQLDNLKRLTKGLVIYPTENFKDVFIDVSYDFKGWIDDNYSKTLACYKVKKRPLRLSIVNYAMYHDLTKRLKNVSDELKGQSFFRWLNSANYRRYIC